MPDRERAADRGARRARLDLVTVGTDIRTARLMAGKTLREVGKSAGLSYSQVGRIERAALPNASAVQLAKVGAVVGLDVRLRAFPGPVPLRDAGQIALLDRLRKAIAPTLTMRTEVALPIQGDLRAWDAVIGGFEPVHRPLHTEAETRVYDAQGQLRRIALKARDAGVDVVLLVISDTPRNRVAVQAAGSMISDVYTVPSREARRALRMGRHPGGSAVIFV